MSEVSLTKHLTGPVDRDAVHVAYVSVQAAHRIIRGHRVALRDDGRAVMQSLGAVGVANPFLEEETIPPGQWFLLLLMPGTVSGLRHHWSHPAFPDVKPENETVDDDDEYDSCRGC